MSILLDTNVLVRLSSGSDPLHLRTVNVVDKLDMRGDRLCITAQCLVEFRNVATRPLAVNGLGFGAASAETVAATFERRFQLLPETPDIFPAWKTLVAAAAVTGKQVHDARLVAVCHAHGVTHLLTFNAAHFQRYASIGPGLIVADPVTV